MESRQAQAAVPRKLTAPEEVHWRPGIVSGSWWGGHGASEQHPRPGQNEALEQGSTSISSSWKTRISKDMNHPAKGSWLSDKPLSL